ncbi:MAG: NAD-dependent epimerase/dehydratase family protein [Armatimonadetes bacterium]|nr:NAD-dependent epimerase/dehydratase family protein [Armatimonadota bacterium]
MKKIVITGSNGFIGSFLAKKLIQQKYDVTCFVRHYSNTELLPENSKIVYVDYSNDKELSDLLQNQEIIIHVAALTRAKKWEQFKKINIELTEKLLDLYNKTPCLKQFIFISSQAAAGPAKNKIPKTESDLCNPISMYGKSKLTAENIIKEKAEKPWTIIRPVAVFGSGEKDFLQIFKMVKKHISIFAGYSKKYLNLIWVDDLTDIIIKTMGNQKAYNQVFFASDGNAYTWNAFISNLEKALNTSSIRFRIPEILLFPAAVISEFCAFHRQKIPLFNREKVKEMKQRYWLVSNKKVKELQNYTASSDLQTNLKKTYEWYKEKGWM